MTASIADRGPVEAEAADLFEALRGIRRQRERDDVFLCCAGARRDIWASGMQRDMGMGLVAYVLALPREAERPVEVKIFDPAPREAIGSVAEQETFARGWLDASHEDDSALSG